VLSSAAVAAWMMLVLLLGSFWEGSVEVCLVLQLSTAAAAAAAAAADDDDEDDEDEDGFSIVILGFRLGLEGFLGFSITTFFSSDSLSILAPTIITSVFLCSGSGSGSGLVSFFFFGIFFFDFSLDDTDL
jgi:hypothetical protein